MLPQAPTTAIKIAAAAAIRLARIGTGIVIEFAFPDVILGLFLGEGVTLQPTAAPPRPYLATTGAMALGLETPSGHHRVSYSDQMSRT